MRRLPLLLLVVGCAGPPGGLDVAPTRSPEAPADAFLEAEQAYDVPAALLAALADAETGVQMVQSRTEHPGRPGACGVMALKDDVRAEAAALAGVSEEDACADRTANVAAAAALLDAWADEDGLQRADLGAWAPLIVRWSEITHPDAAASFVHRAVYDRLRTGVHLEGALLGKVDVVPAWPAPAARSYVDSTGVVWRPSPNFNSRSGADVDFVIVHVCEGGYDGCWSWLAQTASQVSAHYVVAADGSEVTQLVAEADRAWHVAASYDCSRNAGVRCDLTGTSTNTVSVGIEHAGYSSQSSWDPDLIQRSAELLCEVATHHNVPIDATHVLAHAQLQPWNRDDPGAAWPWTAYLDAARAACGQSGGTPAGATVIDSNNDANVPGRTEVVVSGSWTGSTASPGYWNTGYYLGPTEPVADAARFRFRLDSPACLQVEAWWPAASSQGPATWLAWDPAGNELGRATVDQRTNGSRWNLLGTWRFPAGWDEILLSRWAAAGRYVAADAVRVSPSTACGPGGAGGDTDVATDSDRPAPGDTDAASTDSDPPDSDAPPLSQDTDPAATGGPPGDTDTVGAPSQLGCACASPGAPPSLAAALVVGLAAIRRRRR